MRCPVSNKDLNQTYLGLGLLLDLLYLILQVSLHLLFPLLSSLVFPLLESRQELFPLLLIKVRLIQLHLGFLRSLTDILFLYPTFFFLTNGSDF